MCTGAILLYRIPRVVVGENVNFMGSEDLLRSHGVEVIVLDNEECKSLMSKFIQEKPEVGVAPIFPCGQRSSSPKIIVRNGTKTLARKLRHEFTTGSSMGA